MFHRLAGGHARRRADQILRIPVQGERLKIFFLQDIRQTGLRVEKIYNCLAEAVALLLPNEAGIVAVWTLPNRIQIVLWKTVLAQERPLLSLRGHGCRSGFAALTGFLL